MIKVSGEVAFQSIILALFWLRYILCGTSTPPKIRDVFLIHTILFCPLIPSYLCNISKPYSSSQFYPRSVLFIAEPIYFSSHIFPLKQMTIVQALTENTKTLLEINSQIQISYKQADSYCTSLDQQCNAMTNIYQCLTRFLPALYEIFLSQI